MISAKLRSLSIKLYSVILNKFYLQYGENKSYSTIPYNLITPCTT